MKVEDCFQILELKPGATVEEIKAARNDLLQVWHPDKFASNAKLSEKAKEKTQKINEAFNILLDNSKINEQKYDSQSGQASRRPVSQTRKNAADEALREDIKRFAKKQEARVEGDVRRRIQVNRAKRQLNLTILFAFLTGISGLILGLKDWAFFWALVVLIGGLLLAFSTYLKRNRKK